MLAPPPLSVYSKLLEAFGPQGWWPVSVSARGGPVYRPGFKGRLSERQRAEICVGAILTQNTNWNNVVRSLLRLKSAGMLELERLSAAPSGRLQSLVRSSGYFRQKARKLKIFAGHAKKRGRLSRWLCQPMDILRGELLGLWGIGPETADSILLYAGGHPIFVIDAYTLRIGSRLGWFRKPGYERAQRLLSRELPRSAELYAEFHALLVQLAKRHCRAVPSCQGCPLIANCRYGSRQG
ncbi:MAG: endonuclease III domain-containing protein [Elusimicrobia bacterium]|nr:endonuclease III domain-containing protein [Elusimicrobiota bacterium]